MPVLNTGCFQFAITVPELSFIVHFDLNMLLALSVNVGGEVSASAMVLVSFLYSSESSVQGLLLVAVTSRI